MAGAAFAEPAVAVGASEIVLRLPDKMLKTALRERYAGYYSGRGAV